MDESHDESLDTFARDFVEHCARRMAGQFGYGEQDREDIAQQVFLKLADRLPDTNAESPQWKSFVRTAVHRHLQNLARDRGTLKRGRCKTCSINVRIPTPEGPVELAATLLHSDVPSRRANEVRLDEEWAALTLDVAQILEEISDPRLRDVCERLKSASVSQVSRDLDLPRTTLNAWLRKLRCQFEAAGLQEYL